MVKGYLSKSEKEFVKKMAAVPGMTISKIIKKAIREMMGKKERPG